MVAPLAMPARPGVGLANPVWIHRPELFIEFAIDGLFPLALNCRLFGLGWILRNLLLRILSYPILSYPIRGERSSTDRRMFVEWVWVLGLLRAVNLLVMPSRNIEKLLISMGVGNDQVVLYQLVQ